MFTSDFKLVVEKISSPILIAEPIFSPQRRINGILQRKTIDDFLIHFVNSAFFNTFGELAHSQESFSAFENKITDIGWKKAAVDVMEYGKTFEKTFYSEFYSHWFHVAIDKASEKLVCVTFTNVDEDKNHEIELVEQNKKLEAMKDELTLSRENLKGNIERINRLNEKLEYNVYHDLMTGLFGRNKFEQDFKDWIKKSTETSNKFGIMLADIDNMKFINDSSGHSKGDEIIRKYSEILKRIETDDLKFYRFGGDEFIALMNNVESHNSVLNMGNLILELFNEQGIEFSGGISVYPDDGTDFEELLRFADMAMFDSKKKGKNRVGFFQNVMQERFMQKLSIQNKLSEAFGRDSFQSGFQQYYQPQFDIESGKLRGFEALLRWQDEDLGWISPEQFIPIAEETRLMVPLGEWVMETALKTLKEWSEKFKFDGIMSINVSPLQLKKPTFIFDLSNLLEQYQVSTRNLEIEITEGVFIDNKDEILGLLNQIRQMGIGISLDDFGTGYSSLSYLQKLPITTLKIDKSFVSNIAKNGIEADITDTIVTLVTKMGLDTIAEGVENEEQLEVLKKIKCRTVQGFLKGKPMPKDVCEKKIFE